MLGRDLETEERSWVSYHFYYHEDPNLLALDLVAPLVAAQFRKRLIDRFFYIRYALGGPHIRLRLRTSPALREQVVEETGRAAAELLARSPSRKPLLEENIRKTNEALLAADPHETDDAVYADNSFFVTEFRPEIDRYGGPGLLNGSLDFFSISSCVALDFQREHRPRPRAAQLTAMFRVLLQQALGSVGKEEHLLRLVAYAVTSWSEQFPGARKKADDVFLAQQDAFLSLVRSEIESALSARGDSGAESLPGRLLLGRASRRLFQVVGRTDEEEAVLSICASQLHMTANRLGLTNAEEVYLGRLLAAALEEIVRNDSREQARLQGLLQRNLEAPTAGDAPQDFLPAVYSRFLETAGSAP
jgi:thiopeptide-type bacteriocin biosynthesis protein